MLLHTLHILQNFTQFAILSHQKFDDRPLFKPGALWFVVILNCLKMNTFCDIRIIFARNQFQITQSLHFGEQKTMLLFSKNFPNLLNDPWTYSLLTNPKISAPDLFDMRSVFFLLRSEFMSWSTLKNCGFAVRNLVSSRSQSGYKG